MAEGGFVGEKKEIEDQNRKKIEVFFATLKGKGATLTDIETDTKIARMTIKRHLDKMQLIGRLHTEIVGKTNLYYLNGDGTHREIVQFGNHKLFIDVFTSYFGEAFVRIKDRKKTKNGDEDVGAIIINKDKVKELAEKLLKIQPQLQTYN